MTIAIPILCLMLSIGLLCWLCAIDLKYWILPDELNLAFGLTGIIFHVVTAYQYVELADMLIGAIGAAGVLYLIRFFANQHYGRDSLGLGDVKLLGAAGLWLGLESVMQAITVGALAGVLHGVLVAAISAMKDKTPFSVRRLAIPAGPGFTVGILIVGGIKFYPLIAAAFHGTRP